MHPVIDLQNSLLLDKYVATVDSRQHSVVDLAENLHTEQACSDSEKEKKL